MVVSLAPCVIGVGRAMLRDSRVLLLDEITAALDSVSEAALHSALERILKVRGGHRSMWRGALGEARVSSMPMIVTI
jgi:ABC-type taurine transport system ATPase subunit